MLISTLPVTGSRGMASYGQIEWQTQHWLHRSWLISTTARHFSLILETSFLYSPLCFDAVCIMVHAFESMKRGFGRYKVLPLLPVIWSSNEAVSFECRGSALTNGCSN